MNTRAIEAALRKAQDRGLPFGRFWFQIGPVTFVDDGFTDGYNRVYNPIVLIKSVSPTFDGQRLNQPAPTIE